MANLWEACVDIAAAIITLAPERPGGWKLRSFALHQLKRTQEALDQLLSVADRFPTVWRIPYSLACYSAQTGQLARCQVFLKQAIATDEYTVKRAAIDSPELEPLWDSLR